MRASQHDHKRRVVCHARVHQPPRACPFEAVHSRIYGQRAPPPPTARPVSPLVFRPMAAPGAGQETTTTDATPAPTPGGSPALSQDCRDGTGSGRAGISAPDSDLTWPSDPRRRRSSPARSGHRGGAARGGARGGAGRHAGGAGRGRGIRAASGAAASEGPVASRPPYSRLLGRELVDQEVERNRASIGTPGDFPALTPTGRRGRAASVSRSPSPKRRTSLDGTSPAPASPADALLQLTRVVGLGFKAADSRAVKIVSSVQHLSSLVSATIAKVDAVSVRLQTVVSSQAVLRSQLDTMRGTLSAHAPAAAGGVAGGMSTGAASAAAGGAASGGASEAASGAVGAPGAVGGAAGGAPSAPRSTFGEAADQDNNDRRRAYAVRVSFEGCNCVWHERVVMDVSRVVQGETGPVFLAASSDKRVFFLLRVYYHCLNMYRTSSSLP